MPTSKKTKRQYFFTAEDGTQTINFESLTLHLMSRLTEEEFLTVIHLLATEQSQIPVEKVRFLIAAISNYFRKLLLLAGYEERKIRALMTKFRDAGRRSAPWKPTSGRVPGRPQDGADGNRIARWLLPVEHKFYADEVNATLVEVKYYLQTLSMAGAPALPENTIQQSFDWLLDHPVIPGEYKDPIQLIPIDFEQFINNPKYIQSGHYVPLDRGGRHVPGNTFLMLATSNQLQGNQTIDELLKLMADIVNRHQEKKFEESS